MLADSVVKVCRLWVASEQVKGAGEVVEMLWMQGLNKELGSMGWRGHVAEGPRYLSTAAVRTGNIQRRVVMVNV